MAVAFLHKTTKVGSCLVKYFYDNNAFKSEVSSQVIRASYADDFKCVFDSLPTDSQQSVKNYFTGANNNFVEPVIVFEAVMKELGDELMSKPPDYYCDCCTDITTKQLKMDSSIENDTKLPEHNKSSYKKCDVLPEQAHKTRSDLSSALQHVSKHQSLAEVAEALRSGELDLLVYINSLCDVIDEFDGVIQAIVPGTYDRQDIVQKAVALLEQYPDPENRPALFGLPVGVKDIMFTDDFPTLCGSSVPSYLFDKGTDGPIIAIMRKAGAIMMCKTVTTEFASQAPGPTRNPHDINRTPGGSSQGSAAGVALGYYPFATGTQTGGSTIRPASFNGIAGYKCTHGRIAMDGVMPISYSLDTFGLLCRKVEDLRLIAPVVIPGWSLDAKSGAERSSESADSESEGTLDKTGKRQVFVGLIEGAFMDEVSNNARELLQSSIEKLQDNSFVVQGVGDILPNIENLIEHCQGLSTVQHTFYHPWYEEFKDLYREQTQVKLEEGFQITPQQHSSYLQTQRSLRDLITREMEERCVDVLISTSSLDHAPLGLETTGDARMNMVFSYSGHPVISVPMGNSREGLPIGLQVTGKYGQDEELLEICEQIEQILTPNPLVNSRLKTQIPTQLYNHEKHEIIEPDGGGQHNAAKDVLVLHLCGNL